MRAPIFRILLRIGAAVLVALFAFREGPEPDARPRVPAESSAERLERLGLTFGPDVFARSVATSRAPTIDLSAASPLDPNAPGARSRMPLLVAALREDWPTVHQLIETGVDLDASDNTGLTPLMAAAMHGNADIVRELLARKARPDRTDLGGRSALHYAVAAGKPEAVEALLPLTPHLEARASDGRDILAVALDTRNAPIIQAVLNRLPSALQWSTVTRRALNDALIAGKNDLVRLLLAKHPAPPTPEGHNVPLIAYAIANDDVTLFKTLLACGADPNTIIPTPTDKAFIPQIRSSFLRMYVEQDSSVNILMLAAGVGKHEYVRDLLQAGADRNHSTAREKMLPLYFAAHTESWKCTQLLLGSGALPDELRIEISLKTQKASVVKDGVPIFTTTCSTGRAGYSTPAGQYVVTDKDRSHRSTIYKVPMPYFMRLNCRDFGMHEGVVPNYPASHGCIRLPSAAARKLFGEIPVGTVVTIN